VWKFMICKTGLVMEYHSYVGGLAYYYSDTWINDGISSVS